ncbi:hypothetical protein [Citrobacter freundii]|uniref:hypothetical protein n=1 Tax=Citrobacter freundii TaxID=546 RepID=UPI001908C7B1|nr:hypothetical protein [Citrobacter freundii]MBJ8931655.1 hypothetical protein [Citrobacter freundii]
MNKYEWPSGEVIEVICPHCNKVMNTQIAMVREFDLELRPEHCLSCLCDFEVFHNGNVKIVSKGFAKNITNKGKDLLKKKIIFNPDADFYCDIDNEKDV